MASAQIIAYSTENENCWLSAIAALPRALGLRKSPDATQYARRRQEAGWQLDSDDSLWEPQGFGGGERRVLYFTVPEPRPSASGFCLRRG